MRHPVYFLIAPKSNLVDLIQRIGADALIDLTKPIMWEANENDKSILTPEDMDAFVKLLFLNSLRRERGNESSFNALFCGFNESEDYFDGLWSMARMQVDMNASDAIEDALDEGSLPALLGRSNDRVDGFINQIINRNKK